MTLATTPSATGLKRRDSVHTEQYQDDPEHHAQSLAALSIDKARLEHAEDRKATEDDQRDREYVSDSEH